MIEPEHWSRSDRSVLYGFIVISFGILIFLDVAGIDLAGDVLGVLIATIIMVIGISMVIGGWLDE